MKLTVQYLVICSIFARCICFVFDFAHKNPSKRSFARNLSGTSIDGVSTLSSRRLQDTIQPLPVPDSVVLYEESSKYADPHAVATDCIIEITSEAHLNRILSKASHILNEEDAFVDHLGRIRTPHKLVMIEVYATWCRACIGVRPKLLKLCARHPEILCCKLNKGNHEDIASRLGVRGLPTFVLYKAGTRIDHFTSADIDIIEQNILDNT